MKCVIRGTARRVIVRLVNCPFEEMSFGELLTGEMSVGEESVGETSVGNCLSGYRLICCVIVILLYIERKRIFMRNIATILPLNSKFSGNFQFFIAIDGSIEMLKNS